MPKKVPVDYHPSNPPLQFADWHRWISDELFRIAASLQQNPVTLAIEGTGIAPISGVIEYVTIGVGDDALIDDPSGSWDPVTAVWTCPLSGMYSVNVQVTVDAFGSGNKTYYGSVQVQQISPVVDVRAEALDGGDDDVPLSISLGRPLILLTGDQFNFQFGAVHTQFSGDVTFSYAISIVRTANTV